VIVIPAHHQQPHPNSIADARCSARLQGPARPHIAWVIWGDEPLGGVRRALSNFSTGLAARGWRVSIVCLDEGEMAVEARRLGLQVHCLRDEGDHHARYAAVTRRRFGRIQAQIALRRYQSGLAAQLEALAPDVVSTYWPDFLPLVGRVCKGLGIAAVWEIPEVPSVQRFRLNQRVYAALLGHYRLRPIANSRFTATLLGPAPGLTVVYPPSDSAQFDPARVIPLSRSALGLPPDALLLGSIARLSPQKCGEPLIRALALLNSELPHLHLLFVGGPLDSDYGRTLRQLVTALRLESKVHFLGEAPDPVAAHALMDFFVSCRPDPEGFGLSVVEAMLMQKPTLVRALGGPAETVIDGETGWHFESDTPAAIAAAIRRAVADRPRWPAMGAAGRDRAVREFSLEASLPRFEQALLGHLGQHP